MKSYYRDAFRSQAQGIIGSKLNKPNTILTCATENYCFFSAANHIRKGEAEITVAGGTEVAVMPTGVAGF